MNQVIYTIFCLDHNGVPLSLQTDDLVKALKICDDFRKTPGYSFVTMASENIDSVGKPGVDSIKNGICPDGVAYDWVKRRPAVITNPYHAADNGLYGPEYQNQ